VTVAYPQRDRCGKCLVVVHKFIVLKEVKVFFCHKRYAHVFFFMIPRITVEFYH
jgi:hypothetical protein